MKIALCLFLLLRSSFKQSPSCLQIDIILVGDMSASVDGNQGFVSDAFVSFINKFDLSESSMQIGLVLFDTDSKVISSLSSDQERLRRDALSIRSIIPNGTTNMSKALVVSLQEFSINARKGFKKLVIVISDGAVDDRVDTRIIANQLNQLGIQVCGILINDNSAEPGFFKTICSGCYVESDYENLENELKKLDICL